MKIRLGQSKLESVLEIAVSIAIGFGVSFGANFVILPAFGFHISASQNFWITVFFTFVSIVRSYFVRRLFNWWHLKRIAFHYRCLRCNGTITVIKGVWGATCDGHGRVEDRRDFGAKL